MWQLGLVLSIGMIAMLKLREVSSLSGRNFLRSILAFENFQASSEYSRGFQVADMDLCLVMPTQGKRSMCRWCIRILGRGACMKICGVFKIVKDEGGASENARCQIGPSSPS